MLRMMMAWSWGTYGPNLPKPSRASLSLIRRVTNNIVAIKAKARWEGAPLHISVTQKHIVIMVVSSGASKRAQSNSGWLSSKISDVSMHWEVAGIRRYS